VVRVTRDFAGRLERRTVLEKRSSICLMRLMVALLEIVIFQIYEKDAGDEIGEFIDTYAPVCSRHKEIRAETKFSIAHMSIG
jgi:hypothetical protein